MKSLELFPRDLRGGDLFLKIGIHRAKVLLYKKRLQHRRMWLHPCPAQNYMKCEVLLPSVNTVLVPRFPLLSFWNPSAIEPCCYPLICLNSISRKKRAFQNVSYLLLVVKWMRSKISILNCGLVIRGHSGNFKIHKLVNQFMFFKWFLTCCRSDGRCVVVHFNG